ncbi:MAG: SRPBCC domain-containing protein [Bacteroidia bacterium]|nr:SRPBCC domain-containing protein [Bacteroidia bacterium]
METQKNSANAAEPKPLLIKRTFNLPIDKVWAAWSEPEDFKKWWGPNDFTCPEAHIDFRVGGKIHACMKNKNDGKETWSTGIYREIVPHKKIVVTDNFADEEGNVITPAEAGMPGDWGTEPVISLELNKNNDQTEMVLTHSGIPSDMQNDCIDGWNQCFDKLQKFV